MLKLIQNQKKSLKVLPNVIVLFCKKIMRDMPVFLFVFCLAGVLFLFNVQEVKADDCGDTTGNGETDTTCYCGDTVVGTTTTGYIYTLTQDLTCIGSGNDATSNFIALATLITQSAIY